MLVAQEVSKYLLLLHMGNNGVLTHTVAVCFKGIFEHINVEKLCQRKC